MRVAPKDLKRRIVEELRVQRVDDVIALRPRAVRGHLALGQHYMHDSARPVLGQY